MAASRSAIDGNPSTTVTVGGSAAASAWPYPLALIAIEAEAHLAVLGQRLDERQRDRWRQCAKRRRGKRQHADAQAPPPPQRPRIARVSRARSKSQRGDQLALHVDRPDLDIASDFELAEVDHHVPLLQLAPSDPQRIGLDQVAGEKDVDGRPRAKHPDCLGGVPFAERLQEDQGGDVAAQRLRRQQEQRPLAAEVVIRPTLRRQAAQAAAGMEDAELSR